MKVLILGVTGMLGHKVYRVFKENNHNVYGTIRKKFDEYEKYGIYARNDTIEEIDAFNFSKIKRVIKEIKPEIVINCIGIIKPLAKDYINTVYINSLFPHEIAKVCSKINSKLIHISTDCVFSGRKGDYKESDFPDPMDLYGRSKLLGELVYGNHLTIRTSIIGRELSTKNNLVEWFLNQNERVNGFVNAMWSGLTTFQFSKTLLGLIKEYPEVSGLLHIYGEKINKYDLLNLINKYSNKNLKIEKYKDFYCDRSLQSDLFPTLNLMIPPTEEMVETLFSEERH